MLPTWHSGKRTCLPMQETQKMWVRSLGWKDLLEKEMETHSSVLAWRSPRTEEPYGLQSGPWGCKELDTTKRLTHTCREICVSWYRMLEDPERAIIFRWGIGSQSRILRKIDTSFWMNKLAGGRQSVVQAKGSVYAKTWETVAHRQNATHQ